MTERPGSKRDQNLKPQSQHRRYRIWNLNHLKQTTKRNELPYAFDLFCVAEKCGVSWLEWNGSVLATTVGCRGLRYCEIFGGSSSAQQASPFKIQSYDITYSENLDFLVMQKKDQILMVVS